MEVCWDPGRMRRPQACGGWPKGQENVRPMLYFAVSQYRRGGETIVEVFRQAWNRSSRKELLLLYPLFLAIIDVLAFLVVYASDGQRLRWGDFLRASFQRAQFVHDNLVTGFSARPALLIAVAAGLGVCLLSAMVRAPYFRAIAGVGYPLAPRGWGEAWQLTLFYFFSNLVLWVFPLVSPAAGGIQILVLFVLLVVSIVIAFTDYIIVFEQVSLLTGLRRSFQLVARAWPAVVVIVVIYSLIGAGLHWLYGLYYNGNSAVFFLLPVSQVLIEAFLVLFVDLLLIFLYERVRLQAR